VDDDDARHVPSWGEAVALSHFLLFTGRGACCCTGTQVRTGQDRTGQDWM
jgi:hypothetical protein